MIEKLKVDYKLKNKYVWDWIPMYQIGGSRFWYKFRRRDYLNLSDFEVLRIEIIPKWYLSTRYKIENSTKIWNNVFTKNKNKA